MKLSEAVVIAAMLAMAANASAREPNLLRNGGFERAATSGQPITEWQALGGWPGVVLPSSESAEGNGCALFDAPPEKFTCARAWLAMSFPVKPGRTYAFSGLARLETLEVQDAHLGFYVTVSQGHYGKELMSQFLSGRKGWTRIERTFRVPEDYPDQYACLQTGLLYLSGRVWIDDFSMVEITGGAE